MYSAENAGLIKFDFLGLKTLTVINKTQKLISEKNQNFKINQINYNDQKVFELLSKGNTVGIFQLESSGMREALMKMKPNHLEDIIALVALYRPGPMSNIPIYNDCKHGKIKPDYLHPKLEEILKPTYGVIIYQEQVMQIAQKLSGFTASQADILRKAMGKKKRAELEKQKEKFIQGAVQNGISKDIAAGIFLKIEPFAEYGFNKSHAASYAIIAYQTAYLKTYFPNEFFSASMTMDISNQNKLSEFYEELKRLNINVQRPDINKCYADFKSDKNTFYYALGAIKSVGYDAVSNIVDERVNNGAFKSINDFINRVNPKDINKLQLEGLIKAGAFDNIEKNRNSLFSSVPSLITKSKNIFENKVVNQIDLFDSDQTSDEDFVIKTEDWKFEERLSKEFESVGFFISDHPINQFKEFFEIYNIINYSDFISNNNIEQSNISATILKVQEKKTSKGNSYAILKLTDLSGVFELFIFSDLLELNRNIVAEGSSVMLSLKKNIIDDANRFKRINVLKIVSMNKLLNEPIKNIEFLINNISQLKTIKEILGENGNSNVKILFKDLGQKFVFNLKNKRKISRKSLSTLKNDNILSNIY
jgi:DNA polymerase-3 subunit alpha